MGEKKTYPESVKRSDEIEAEMRIMISSQKPLNQRQANSILLSTTTKICTNKGTITD